MFKLSEVVVVKRRIGPDQNRKLIAGLIFNGVLSLVFKAKSGKHFYFFVR